jgi:hypothetical protein
MLLAFATFVGLGGDDIPKTIFSICFGLVLGAIGRLRPDFRRAAARAVRHHRLPAGHRLPRAGHRRLRHRRDALDHRAIAWRGRRPRRPKMTGEGHGLTRPKACGAAGRARRSARFWASSSASCLRRGDARLADVLWRGQDGFAQSQGIRQAAIPMAWPRPRRRTTPPRRAPCCRC